MEKQLYEEMMENLNQLVRKHAIQDKRIYLFGHCRAAEELADVLLDRGFDIAAILDNNAAKQGNFYRGIEIRPPREIMAEAPGKTCVCIAARAYAAMAEQLRCMGYGGQIYKLINYNSYAEYSVSEDTIARMRQRVKMGMDLLRQMEREHPNQFKILCPFSALGDIYFMLSYLPFFLRERGIENCVIGVIGRGCGEVVGLFGSYETEIFTQKDMDGLIQAALFTGDKNVFIPHQDRPYVVNLSRALYVKRIPLEQLYCCGVFGLSALTEAARPTRLREYSGIDQIEPGRSVILAPYAKSVAGLPSDIWGKVVDSFRGRGCQCYTNVSGKEEPLPGTLPISPTISEIQSVVERAGTFIGIRSGLCDVLREASCRKIALYPDYNYCDTRWKAIDMYKIEGWENIVIKEGFSWKENN